MKQQTAKLNYLKIAPRKVRLIANAVKKLPINEAEARLLTSPKRVAEPILKLLRSAIANAKNNQQMEVNRLFIKEIKVDQGPMLKRWMPRARGQANMIQKKGSHITIILAESDKLKAPRFNIVKPERIKKSELEKIKKQKAIEKEKPKETLKAEVKSQKGPGFIKRMFRRKSI
ncbi:MAG: 50S ribosomal protein L22 [Candidatus Paceibacterota bacterium]